MLDIEQIKAREQAATKGPWFFDANGDWGINTGVTSSGYSTVIVCGMLGEHEASFEDTYPIGTLFDGQFIASARQDIPALISEVERQKERADGYENIIVDLETELAMNQQEVKRLQAKLDHKCELLGEG